MSYKLSISLNEELSDELERLVNDKTELLKTELLTMKRELTTKRWYSPEEAILYLGIGSTTTLRKYAKLAGIKPKRLSKKMVRYDVMDLNKIFMEDRLSNLIKKQKK